nr:hypothetical protein GCM10020093_084360 [Planobispora longispora]
MGLLSTDEKIAAAGLRQLIAQYKALAKSVEPEVLQTFNAGLGVASSLLPRLAPITKSVARELTAFAHEMEDALNSERADQFFATIEREAPQAIDALGDALGSGAHLAASLTESLMPLATAGLGAISMVADLVAGLSDLNPELAQAAVLMLALRSPISGLGGLIGKSSGRYKEFAAENEKASKATKLLNAVSAAGPNLYLAAATAIGFFAVKAATAKSASQELAEAMRKEHQAVGNNIAGYRSMNAALDAQLVQATQRLAAAEKKLASDASFLKVEMYKGALAAQDMTRSFVEQEKAANNQSIKNIQQGAAALAKQYGITTEQAERLAIAVGVDLSKGVLENGTVTAATTAKINRYRDAVATASNPTLVVAEAWKIASDAGLDMKTRIEALTTALGGFNAALGVLSASNAMKEALAASNKVLRDGNATMLERSQALEAQLAPIGRWVEAQLAAKKSVSLTDKALRDQFPSLIKLSQGSAVGKAALDGLIASMGGTITRAKGATTITDRFGNAIKVLPNGKVVKIDAATKKANADLETTKRKHANMHGKTSTVTVRANTGPAAGAFRSLLSQFTVPVSIPVGIRAPGATGGLVTEGRIVPRYAAGGPVHGPGTGTSDDVPALLSNGEYVINARSTARHRELLEAINAGKFAAGGLVGYASGGAVQAANVPISEFVSRFMDGKPLSRSEYLRVYRARRDAVDQLRRAERKLAEDRKKGRSARTIADDEARVAKERRDLATATERLTIAQARYKKGKLTPLQRLNAGLVLGIKNTGAFIANITRIADRGFVDLAQQLLAMGGPDAEKMAAAAAKLSTSKLKSLNTKVVTASRNQARLEALPNVLLVRSAQKGGAKSVADYMRHTGLSEEDLAAAFAAMGKASPKAAGGIERYAAGGRRPGPGIATRPTVLFGEGERRRPSSPTSAAIGPARWAWSIR